jgi:hypothetical protein
VLFSVEKVFKFMFMLLYMRLKQYIESIKDPTQEPINPLSFGNAFQYYTNPYVMKFVRLESALDILEATSPLGNKPMKEVSESIGILEKLRKIVLKEPNKYTLYDICAGNALTSVIAAFLLPIDQAIAIDKNPRERKWDLVKDFSYDIKNIRKLEPNYFEKDSIIISVHPCRDLAERVIELYNESEASHLILMPCCVGNIDKRHQFAIKALKDKYLAWTFQLADYVGGGAISIDKKVISPKNSIIVAHKE